MSRSEPVLVTLPISHFCEKARWALDRAGVAYVERRHMQIIHQFAARLAGGGKSVPVLKTGDGVFAQSHDIMVYADSFLPEPARLYPADKTQRAEVRRARAALRRGARRRGTALALPRGLQGRQAVRVVQPDRGATWERLAFPFVVAPAKIYINRFLDIDDATAARALELVDEELDAVADLLSDGRAYLTGERFTAADLAFAALSAPLIVPTQYGTPLPQPEQMPERMAAPVQRLARASRRKLRDADVRRAAPHARRAAARGVGAPALRTTAAPPTARRARPRRRARGSSRPTRRRRGCPRPCGAPRPRT